MLHRLVVIVVELDGMHLARATQVQFDPLSVATAGCTPVGAHVLIGEICSDKGAVGTRNPTRLTIGEQHPTRKTVGGIFDVMVSVPTGIVAEGCIAVHHAVLVKGSGIKPDAPLKLILEREHTRTHVPVVAVQVGKSAAMPYPLHKSAGFVTHGVVLLIGERAQRIVGDINAVGIHLELGARCAVLEIILAAVLGHEGALGKGFKRHLVVIVHPETFPTVAVGMQPHKVVYLTDGGKVVSADFNALEGVFVA